MSDNLRSIAAAIAATFADWRTVKGRKALQLVFEVPLEQQAEVLTMLGAPLPDNPKWCAIAVMNSPVGTPQPQHERTTSAALDGRANHKPTGELQRQRYAAMSPAEQAVARAAMLPKDEQFRAWLSAKWYRDEDSIIDEETAVRSLRNICCDCNSRKLIAEVPEYLDRFLQMETEYRMDTGQMARPR